tara:strand:+ start:7796 stop:8029 length:234 start_codon:yes stop_codon:yes gene_type:complete
MNYSDHELLLAALQFAEEFHRVSDTVRAQLKELVLGNTSNVSEAVRNYAEDTFVPIRFLGDGMLDAVTEWDDEQIDF